MVKQYTHVHIFYNLTLTCLQHSFNFHAEAKMEKLIGNLAALKISWRYFSAAVRCWRK